MRLRHISTASRPQRLWISICEIDAENSTLDTLEDGGQRDARVFNRMNKIVKRVVFNNRVLVAAWFAGLIALVAVLVYPVGIGILRVFIIVAVTILWLFGIYLIRRVKWLLRAALVLSIILGSLLILPGRGIDPVRLQSEYLRQLSLYEGTPYVWGGENRLGIDCSGLVRNALINANAHLGITRGNPRALRTALNLWWYDCSAKALRDQYHDLTMPVFSAQAINTITNSLLMPGDIAVTAGGVHVLAYLGDKQWIEADPSIQKVVILSAPSENVWFTVPVDIMRWTDLSCFSH